VRRVLITGIAGFVGSHLAERLAPRFEVWGTCIDDNTANLSGMEGVNLVKCDLLDRSAVEEVVGRIEPDTVFHLAAQSIPSFSFSHPEETLKTNIFSTLNIFESVLKAVPDAVVLNIGSGDEYGDAASDILPVPEKAELKPLNPYAVSKVAQDLLAFQYWRSRGLKAVRARPFNHFGPRQSDCFVTSEFARQIAEIEAGIRREKALEVGNLRTAKDFLDVRDVVAAYELLVEKGSFGEAYNVCSGRATSIREIAETLISFSTEKITIREDPARRRHTETAAIYGDAAKIKALGWVPKYTLRESLESIIGYWREAVLR